MTGRSAPDPGDKATPENEFESILVRKDGTVVYNSADQTIPSGNVTRLAWDSIDFDNLGIEDLANDRLVIEDDGLYLINATVNWGGSADWGTGDRCGFKITAGGSDYGSWWERKVGTGQEQKKAPSVLAQLSTDDVIYASVYQDSGVDQTLTGGIIFNNLSVVRVG